MASVQNGNTVKVHYTGRLESGEVFDSSKDRAPLEFKVGDGNMIPGFENAVIGMNIGESKIEKILAENAYGQRMNELVVTLEKNVLPPDMKVAVGQELDLRSQTGEIVPVIVVGLDDKTVTLDANHPLAGKDLFFEIQIVEIN